MPVRAKHSSEYHKKFRWNDSVKSSSFTPTKEQQALKAGLSSVDFAETYAITREPALQRRRKPIPVDNKMTYTTKQYMAAIESDASLESDDIGKPSRKPGTSLAKTYVRRDSSVLKRDSGATKSREATEKEVKTQKNNAIAAKTRVITNARAPPPPATKRKDPPTPVKTAKGPVTTKTERPSRAGGDTHKANGKAPPETDEALQYRAGIRARPGGPRYSSEYQRQFAWKQPSAKESPLMAAEQMVHNSNANLAPYVPDKIPRHSEYQRQFKQQQQQPGHSSAQDQLMQNAQQEIKAKYRVKTKNKKSKRVGIAPDRMPPAGVVSVISHDDPRLLKQSQNPQRPFFPHAATRKWRTEYKSNFKTPQLFSYENGVWKGADPPHVQPRDDASDAGKPLQRSKSVGDIPSWFAEVMELRERAKEYQKRSRGTHFSREHLAQLIAAQAKLWEETANGQQSASSSVSGRTSGSEKKDEQKEKLERDVPVEQKAPPVKKLLYKPSDQSSPEGDNRNHISAPQNRRSSSSSIMTQESTRSLSSSLSSGLDSSDGTGRPPTPTLKAETSKARHHLDRTTPAREGALLTSPAAVRKAWHAGTSPQTQRQARDSKPNSKTYVSRPATTKAIIPGGITNGFEYDSDDEDDDDGDLDRTLTDGRMTPPRSAAHQNQISKRTQLSPSAGVRTSDPHLLDESLSPVGFQRHSEHFFETSPAMPRLPNKIEPPEQWAAPRQALKTAPPGRGPLERPHSGSIAGRPQTAIPESRRQATLREHRTNSFMSPRADGTTSTPADDDNYSDLGVAPLRGRRDSDELSTSTLSNASSISLASEVLERAKKRRDEFWGKEKRE
ncbi:nuclear protein MDM1-like [Diadema antillarum]|uniref:nuclear protein MDM1-like n=1 Tax=Diadema antillarum TaxID=105358 RepID=UPI003A8BD668